MEYNHHFPSANGEILRQHGVADEVFAQGTPAYNRSRTKWYTSFGGDGPVDRRTLYETGGIGGHGSGREQEYRDSSAIAAALKAALGAVIAR